LQYARALTFALSNFQEIGQRLRLLLIVTVKNGLAGWRERARVKVLRFPRLAEPCYFVNEN